MPRNIKDEIALVCAGVDLSRTQIQDVFASVMAGDVGEVQLAALLIALKAKGESVDEIAGAAEAMRAAATGLPTGDLRVSDSCGTGGDGAKTVNISTAAAIVAAEGGAVVAKHGNRSISSLCGSADVLEQLGIKLESEPHVAVQCLRDAGICFLFAPQYHPGVRHAMPVRRALAVRTMFNLLGPLANPALPAYQLMGVYDPTLCTTLATTLGKLGVERAMVVHGDGLDEIALHAPTTATWVEGDGEHCEVKSLTLRPEDVGLSPRALSELAGGAPEENARWLAQLLAGQGTAAHNEAVAINAGALLWLSGNADDHRAGTDNALEILNSGTASGRFDRWRTVLNESGHPEDERGAS